MWKALSDAVSTLVVVDSALYVAAVLVFLVGKLIYDLVTPFKMDTQLVEEDNPAVGTAFGGYYIGLGLVVAGALGGAPRGLMADTISLLVWGGLGIVAMLLARWCNDRLILSRIANTTALADNRRVGVGAALAGSYVATGFLIQGVIVEGGSPQLLATLFVAGQLVLIAAAWVYGRLAQGGVQEAIDRPEGLAAGVSLGGFLIAVGILLRAAARTPADTWSVVLGVFLAYAIVGLGLLAVTYMVVDRLSVRGTRLSVEIREQNNVAAALLSAAAYIVIALLQDVAL